MFRLLQLLLSIVLIVILQVTVFPAYIDEAFKPNLIIILICFLALRGEHTVAGAVTAYGTGLIQGVFSGFYFGLFGISSLFIYFALRKVSDQLYTESPHLLAFAVFIASIADSMISLLLITLLSSDTGIYSTILTYMFLQAFISASIAALFYASCTFVRQRLVS
ncbi:MAG: rod shape-determining protein MreD [Geobacteraceae bacterium]|nr:rod shape-determining protein MreD [Geobacteraceae bacterium]